MKNNLRKHILSLRSELDQSTVDTKSREITTEVMRLPAFVQAKHVMVYLDFKNEVRTDTLIRRCLMEGKRVYVPITGVANKTLTPSLLLNYPEDLTEGPYGILEPRQECVRPIDPLELDIVIVPGVAFDEDLNRLGYGGGFYDRFLLRVKPETIFMALAFELQIIETVYPEQHDLPMDYIITEDRIISK